MYELDIIYFGAYSKKEKEKENQKSDVVRRKKLVCS